MDDKIVLMIIYSIFILFWLFYVIREIKIARNSAPNGKTFIKRFHEKIVGLLKVQQVNHIEHLNLKINNELSFVVKVIKEVVPPGLQYETIPMYESYCVYINGEAVCRVHVIEVHFKKKAYLEFSSKRKTNEIVDIIESTYNNYKKDLDNYYNSLSGIKLSFYDSYTTNK